MPKATPHQKIAQIAAKSRDLCGHMKADGTTCSHIVPPGATACTAHRDLTSRKEVQRALVDLRASALRRLTDIVELSENEKLVARIAFQVLDRTGFGPKSTVVVEDTEDMSQLTPEQLRERIESLRTRAQQIVAKQNAPKTSEQEDETPVPGVH
jgi:hypothetical protein